MRNLTAMKLYLRVLRRMRPSGVIIPTYDEKGKIINSTERYNNITLPAPIRSVIFEKYPNWTIHKDQCLVSYVPGKDLKRTFKVQVRKDDQKKNIKIEL